MVWEAVSSAVVFMVAVSSAVVSVNLGLGERWNGAGGQRVQRAAACSASAGGSVGTRYRACPAPVPLVFYQLNRGATAGATTECPVGQVTARRGKEAATRWSKGQERLTALARAIAQSTAVDCLDVKPAQVQQALAPLWESAEPFYRQHYAFGGGGTEQTRSPANRNAMRRRSQQTSRLWRRAASLAHSRSSAARSGAC